MTITRTVNGKELSFELDSQELYEAYREQEFRFDRNDCEDCISCMSDEEVRDTYGVSAETFHTLLDEMASEKRRNMDKYEMSWDYARDEAVKSVIGRYLDEHPARDYTVQFTATTTVFAASEEEAVAEATRRVTMDDMYVYVDDECF